MEGNLLTIRDLVIHFHTYRGVVKALDGVNLSINKGEAVGLVGETGSGKTVTALTIMRLLEPNAKILNGQVLFEGRDLLKVSEEEMRKIRGKEISMVFQEPKAALNPVLTIGYQLVEAIMAHREVEKDEARKIAVNMLKKVGLPDPERLLKRYPHELSGGMAQRVMIAMALLMRPKLLIADEPTSALDVTVQAQILDLMKELIEEINTSVLYITHDLGVAAEICDKIAVMYAGNVVEYGDIYSVFEEPLHPYTVGLLNAIPRLGRDLYTIKGEIPDLINPPSGCRFHPRCPKAMEVCKKVKPKLVNLGNGRYVACHLYERGG